MINQTHLDIRRSVFYVRVIGVIAICLLVNCLDLAAEVVSELTSLNLENFDIIYKLFLCLSKVAKTCD